MAGRARLLAGLLALALASQCSADPTTSLMTQMLGSDPDDCGLLRARCCWRKPATCGSPQLTCAPLEGAQDWRCYPCGDDGQPACGNSACNDATLQAVEVPGKAFKICVDAPPTIAPAAEAAADTTTTTNAKGGNKTAAAADDKAAKRKRRNDKRKKDADAGRQMRGVGCGDPAAGVTCRGRNQCVAGVCLACGGLDQPCCAGKRNACTQYDGQGRVACVDDADAGTKMCRAAPRQS